MTIIPPEDDLLAMKLLDQRVELEMARLEEKISLFRSEIDKKLEYLNGVREALRDQAARSLSKEEAEQRLNALNARLEAQIHNLSDRMESDFRPINEKLGALGKPNWSIMGTVATFGIATITGCWLIIGLKIDASMAPVNLSLEQIKVADASRDRSIETNTGLSQRVTQEGLSISSQVTALNTLTNQLAERLRQAEASTLSSQQADSTSKTDRGQLNDRMRMLESHMGTEESERKAFQAANLANLKELESQFHNLSDWIGFTKDHMQQLFGLIWPKVFNQPLPQTFVRPMVYRNNP